MTVPWAAMIEALKELAVAWHMVRRRPFSATVRQLGQLDLAVEPIDPAGRWPEAHRVSRAIHAVSRRLPWTSTCLMQAVAAQRMLRRRGIASTCYLGMAATNAATDPLAAHAWVRVGDHMITGFCNEADYRVIAVFA